MDKIITCSELKKIADNYLNNYNNIISDKLIELFQKNVISVANNGLYLVTIELTLESIYNHKNPNRCKIILYNALDKYKRLSGILLTDDHYDESTFIFRCIFKWD